MNLADLLDDLAETAVPPPVAPAALWTAGRRRRRARQARTALAVLALVGVLALVLPSTGVTVPSPGYARTSSAGVDGHPERIGRQWVVRDLPDRPGPVAALLQTSGQFPNQWYAVRADGHRWRLPLGPESGTLVPTISQDGTKVGYLEDVEGPYVVRDLATGRRTAFTGLGDNVVIRSTTYGLFDQTPGSWSPDGRHLLLQGFERAGTERQVNLVLDVAAGTVTPLPRSGFVAGWAADDRFVTVDDRRLFDDDQTLPVEVVTRDLMGREVSRVPLRPRNGELAPTSQWTGVVDPGLGTLGLSRSDGFEDAITGVRTFFLASGIEFAAVSPVVPVDGCGTAVGPSTGRPIVPVEVDGALQVQVALVEQGNRFTVIDPRLRASCVLWATQALDRPGRGAGLLGLETAGLLWWWREVLLGTAAVAGVVVLAVRRRRRAPPSPAPGAGVDWYA